MANQRTKENLHYCSNLLFNTTKKTREDFNTSMPPKGISYLLASVSSRQLGTSESPNNN